MSVMRIASSELERHCERYGSALVDAIRSMYPEVNGVHIVPSKEWFRIARAVRKGKPDLGIGAGDAVAAIANPIARIIDAVFKTKIAGCKRCGQRRRKWNDWWYRLTARIRALMQR